MDEDLQNSGALVQLAILSYSAHYNDEPCIGKRKASSIQKVSKKEQQDNGVTFYGDNLKCDSDTDSNPVARCGGVLTNQTQHYAYKIVAQRMVEICRK